METIWKFELDITDRQDVIMPDRSVILSVSEQHGRLCIWAIVNPNLNKRKRSIVVFGTGNPMWGGYGKADLIGTAVVGQFVWHVFDSGWNS